MKSAASQIAQADPDSARSLLMEALKKLAKEDHDLFRLLLGLFVPIKRKSTDEALIQQFNVALDDEGFRKSAKLIIAEIQKTLKGGKHA